MPRTARTSLLAVAGLVGALLGITPAQATPEGAVPLFEPAVTEGAQDIQPLGRTAAGLVYTEAYTYGVWVQQTGGDPVLDEGFPFPTVVGDLITDEADAGSLSWRTIADPEAHVHEIPVGVRFEARTETGYVGRRGSGPYEIVHVDLLDGGALTVVGTSTTAIGNFLTSSVGVAAMTAGGNYRYFPLATPGLGKAVPTPGRYLECPWLSRAHLFCYSDTGVDRISVSTGASTSTSAMPSSMIETSTGVAFLDYVDSPDAETYVLKTWATAAPAPATRVEKSFGLSGSVAPAGTAGTVLVGRAGPLGRAGIWSIPLGGGSATLALAAPAEPRRADWSVAVSPGSVAWADNSDPSGNLWTRDLDADGTPTGENRLIADEASSMILSVGAGRFTYASNAGSESDYYTGGIQLVDGERTTTLDEDHEVWTSVLSGERLLTESMSYFDEESVWTLRDLRTGTATPLADAMDYDLWGERLVRMDRDGRIRLYDLRAGGVPVELRPASDAWTFGSVHVAGDTVAWDVLDPTDFAGLAGERATRNVVTLDPAVPLPDDLLSVVDLSTGYALGFHCADLETFADCVTKAIALDDGAVTDLGAFAAVVDGATVAGIDEVGMPSVLSLPAYTDAPRLLAHPDPSELAGPGRTWRARVVTSQVLSSCGIEIRDAVDAAVRTLDCVDPQAAATVEWDGTDELGEPVPAGEYTWHLAGAADSGALVDYDGGVAALAGPLTVSGIPAPTVTASSPVDGDQPVLQNANVTVEFSEAVTGVSGTTFTLSPPGGEPVAAAVTPGAGGDTATLNPTGNLLPDTGYTATLTGGEAGIVGDIGGPLETVSWTFTTGPAPVLVSLAPASNGTSATTTGNLVAGFSEPVTGVGAETFELATEGGDPVAGAVSYSGTTRSATFNPTASLAPDTRYTATLTGGPDAVRDAAGNPFTTRSWSFTTGPAPTVTGTLPAANATSVSRTGNVVAAFGEAVTGVSGTTVKLKTSTGAAVSAVVSYSTTSRKVTVNPNATLAAATRYTVTLTGGTTAIRDTAGNPLATTTWSFTTGS